MVVYLALTAVLVRLFTTGCTTLRTTCMRSLSSWLPFWCWSRLSRRFILIRASLILPQLSIRQLSENSTVLTVNDSESGLPQLQEGLLAGSYNAFEPSPKPSCQMENASILPSRSGWVMLVGCSGLTTGQECAPKTGTVITISEVASEDWGAYLGPAGPLRWRWSCAVADPPPRRCFPRGNIGAVEIISLVITISSRRGGEGAMEHIQ